MDQVSNISYWCKSSFALDCEHMKERPNTAVKLLHYDHEVMSLSLRNSPTKMYKKISHI
jgi:hypothetical protein